MTLHPPSTGEDEASNGMVSHKVFDRARVEVVKI